MRQVVSIASALGVALLLGSQAVAQQPPPNPPAGGTPEAMPFDIAYGLAITTDKAKQRTYQRRDFRHFTRKTYGKWDIKNAPTNFHHLCLCRCRRRRTCGSDQWQTRRIRSGKL